MAPAIDGPTRTMPIVLWVLRALMAALFLFAAFAKLSACRWRWTLSRCCRSGNGSAIWSVCWSWLGGISVLIPTDFWARRDRAACGRRGGVFRPNPVPAPGLDSSHRHWSNPRRPHLPAARHHSRTIGDVSLSAAASYHDPSGCPAAAMPTDLRFQFVGVVGALAACWLRPA